VALPLDDQMMPGVTYTFTLLLGNWITMPDPQVILNDLNAQAPDYVLSPSASWKSGAGLFTNYMLVTFNYGGNGSDVVGQVGAEIVAAIKAGSNDDFSLVQVDAAAGSTVNPITGASAPGPVDSTGFSISNLGAGLPSSSTLVIAVIGIGLIVFLVSGGPQLVRGVR
jgi:hypothetical protein